MVSSSVLRCSCYKELKPTLTDVGDRNCGPGGGGGGGETQTETTTSFPAHTDSSFLTASLARSGLEILPHAGAAADQQNFFQSSDEILQRTTDEIRSFQSIDEILQRTTDESRPRLVVSLWAGDFLEVLSANKYRALPHRIRWKRGSDIPPTSDFDRHNITYLLRPCDAGEVQPNGIVSIRNVKVRTLKKFLDEKARSRRFPP